MKLTAKLLQKMHDPAFADNGGDNCVLRFRDPRVVCDIYKEHVRGWVNASSLTPDDMASWRTATDWMRSLEDAAGPRLFGAEKFVEKVWWKTQCLAMVSRRPTPRRLKLPLGKEIDVCIAALLPHAIMWLLGLVSEKHLEIAMHPKSLLQRLFQTLRKSSAQEIKALFARCRVLYPKAKHMYSVDQVTRACLNMHHLSHWPGLRLCPPFFPDLIALQPVPSLSRASSGKYVVLHACHGSYATTSIQDSTTCVLETLFIAAAMQPMLLLRVKEDNATRVFDLLGQLHGMHPRSFPPTHGMSPFVPAAKVLPDLVDSGTLRLSEHPLDNRDSGFSFTYMPPRVLDETCVAWKTDECFDQVEMVYQEGLHCFYLSPYIG